MLAYCISWGCCIQAEMCNFTFIYLIGEGRVSMD
nr:MAG TPA: hypothetical protein [Caudoviricetes sp.]